MKLVEEGEGERAVVLAHGYGYGRDEALGFFVVLSEALQRQGFAVYRFDFEETTLTDEIAQLESVIREVRPEHKRVFLVGMSTGGLAAALEKERVDYKILLWPVVDAAKTFERLVETKHRVGKEWLEDCKRYSLAGKALGECLVICSDRDEYIEAEEYDSVACRKKLLHKWAHGPVTRAQMLEVAKIVAATLSKLR